MSLRHYFDASHQLPDTDNLVTKACARLHGHTYAVIVEIEADTVKGGMIIDFKAVKNTIDVLDHQHINDIFDRFEFNHEPTAENIAKFLSKQIEKELDFKATVSICEGYKGAERASWVTHTP
ncbi:6-pyruvoyl trahydropterin synthase family protein [Polynucleobacter sp.]|uniref:6-pyruvoyl trahydropterin synthase family protein n=1 Tax=Polynucleobacter sp. TaxID=2029855 RepID=UPI003F6A094E